MKKDVFSKLQQLTTLIEIQLEWGKAESWTNKDFETLSEQIFVQTDKQISVTTLKRLWGRAKLIANPSIPTLDILAEFAGFEDWRSFLKQLNAKSARPSSKTANTSVSMWGMFGLLVVVIGAVGTLLLQQDKPQKESSPTLSDSAKEAITFDFEKVTVGYPNTVIFRYDIGDIPYDSLAIQQSWDQGKRIKLDQAKGLATTTYYYPGYYATKLIINDEVIQEKDLYIPTDGWQSFVGGNVAQLIYVKPDQLIQARSIRIHSDVLAEMNRHSPTHLWLSNLLPEPSINGDHFDIETNFRLVQPTEKSICQNMWVVITGAKEVLRFQLSTPGCVGDLMFFLSMDMISGKDHDLSAFGVAPNDWTNFKVKNRHNQIFVSINDEPVFAHELPDGIGSVGGIQFIFEGLGEVDVLKMTDKDETIDLIQ